FISGLHLSASRPEINRVFFEYLRGSARGAESIYILGDLFEYWAGDDDLDEPFNASVVGALAESSRAGPSLHVMHGNRDFLLGADFAAACNARLIDDPHSLDLFGTRTLLMHGHTHRPARHEHRVDGRVCERWVLPDWYESGGVLACDEKGCRTQKP